MKKVKIMLLALGVFCTLSSYAQEEFFGNNTGLSFSGSTNFTDTYGAGLSLYTKKGWILSTAFSEPGGGSNLTAFSIGYLKDISKKEDEVTSKLIMGLIYSDSNLFNAGYRLFGPNLGMSFVMAQKSNFPLFFGAACYAYLGYETKAYDGFSSGLLLNYTQSFFAKNAVYPFVGLSYSIPLTQANGDGSFLFHVGLNIRLSNPDTDK